jgi:hypothetical protein
LNGTTVLPVDIVGVNQPQYGPSPSMYTGKPLSWIRDHNTAVGGPSPASITTAWSVSYRDVFILDPLNGKIEVYNLLTNDLTVAANKQTLKNKLIAAATPADTDNDKLPDYWEQWAFGTLSRNAATTGPDGLPALLHYAHGNTAPGSGVLPGLPRIVFLQDISGMGVSVVWTQRRGTAFGLTMTPEFSTALASWTTTGHGFQDWSVRPLYDGSGGEIVEWHSTLPNPFRFARVRTAVP